MTLTSNPIPDHAFAWMVEAIETAGIPATLMPDRHHTIAFGDVDIPHGHAYRLAMTGTPGGGYTVEITDPAGDELFAAASALRSDEVVALCQRVTA